ncbi:hypothetical protein Q8791_30470 [Nocardiopsis sp. CT-R113]|uniref:Uncharacterized protein n=1 Tax=Nocardiopsis codii TaxID=3065942 RepID=A0ABU7KH40_9ACTN|nr:hypothetical protein [Nocardiopsis sp. CT-R113]MEE2041555.1 hypothetical protein [Nocardiopsis sp. CT-R113]
MQSQPTIAQVAIEAGATRADVVRVLTQGGTTEADWHIARTIERLGGRRASELVLMAGRDQMIAEIWGDSGAVPALVAATNELAEYDSEVRVYPESTAPDAPTTVAPHHPGDDTPAEEDEDARAERHQVRLWAVVAGLIAVRRGTDPEATKTRVDSIVARWTTPDDVREGLTGLLRRTAERAPELRAAHAQRLLDTYVTAA